MREIRALAEQKITTKNGRERSTEKFMPCEACEADEKWIVWETSARIMTS